MTESDPEDHPLAIIDCRENIKYIRNNQRQVVSWWGLRSFDISRQVQIARRLKEIRQALRRGDITFADLELGRLEWHFRVWWARKHRLLRWFYIRVQIFTLKYLPQLHRSPK
jgi:hypothetical protein